MKVCPMLTKLSIIVTGHTITTGPEELLEICIRRILLLSTIGFSIMNGQYK